MLSCFPESENESGDGDYSANLTLEHTDAVYRDWLVALDREDKKMMAMMLHDYSFWSYQYSRC